MAWSESHLLNPLILIFIQVKIIRSIRISRRSPDSSCGWSCRDLRMIHITTYLESTHLEVHFNLICFQVLLSPHIATQRLRNISITGTPVVRSFWSSRTKKKSSQYSSAYTGYGPNCLTHDLFPYFHKGMDYVFILKV